MHLVCLKETTLRSQVLHSNHHTCFNNTIREKSLFTTFKVTVNNTVSVSLPVKLHKEMSERFPCDLMKLYRYHLLKNVQMCAHLPFPLFFALFKTSLGTGFSGFLSRQFADCHRDSKVVLKMYFILVYFLSNYCFKGNYFSLRPALLNISIENASPTDDLLLVTSSVLKTVPHNVFIERKIN